MKEVHSSDSIEQRQVEESVKILLEKRLGYKLDSGLIVLDENENIRIQVDAFNETESVFIEIYSGTGTLKPAQIKKVITDGFKLVTLEKMCFPGCRKIICFVDKAVLESFQSQNWYSKAFKIFGIETMIQEISLKEITSLKNAKIRQYR